MTEVTSPLEIEQIAARADLAADVWSQTAAAERATALVAIADALDGSADTLVPLAMAETNLTEARLRGELRRTTFQLRIFAEALAEGSFLDARIDHADAEWPMGAPRPDLRRILIPLGPVVVFAASNFPFAFSVGGGDTASALAAGCSVIVKVHSGHPELSQATGDIITSALAASGAPAGLFALIYGTEAGKLALQDSRVKAGAFTGSIAGGRALFDIAQARPEPIPFYGELGSVNPVFVTESAAQSRAQSIATEFIASFTLGAGQFCTKPGVLFVPRDSAVLEALTLATLPAAQPLLNSRIFDGYVASLSEIHRIDGVSIVSSTPASSANPPAPSMLATSIDVVLADPHAVLAEVFGPAALIVEYDDESQLLEVAGCLDGQLTTTILGDADDAIVPDLIRQLSRKTGRLLWNQWPTGVSVTYAQQHGGPYPATTAVSSTSVGTAAIERFLRPIAYQGLPQHLLPTALRDTNELMIPRRVNGSLALGRDLVGSTSS
jgi:NADP-dependent aldehyde dehydrogenase